VELPGADVGIAGGRRNRTIVVRSGNEVAVTDVSRHVGNEEGKSGFEAPRQPLAYIPVAVTHSRPMPHSASPGLGQTHRTILFFTFSLVGCFHVFTIFIFPSHARTSVYLFLLIRLHVSHTFMVY